MRKVKRSYRFVSRQVLLIEVTEQLAPIKKKIRNRYYVGLRPFWGGYFMILISSQHAVLCYCRRSVGAEFRCSRFR